MKLSKLIKYEISNFNLVANNKNNALEQLTSLLIKENIIKDKNKFLNSLIDRENQSTTGVGNGIAIPHTKSNEIKETFIIYAKCENPLDWHSLDNKPIKHIFMICASENNSNEHLKALSSLSSALLDKNVISKLETVNNSYELKYIFKNFEQKQNIVNNIDDKPYIVAVTACPTGIAHTFMAAERLKEAAKKLNVNIKVETNGQIGVENKLSNQEIDNALGVIVAADKQVELSRFNGKRTIITKVSDGINKPEELIQNILDEKASYYNNNETYENTDSSNDNLGRKVYKHLMEGVSNMLPFVVAGGMLIAIAFMWGITSFDPKASDYNKTAEFIFLLGKFAFSMMLPILAGFIGRSIADRPGFVIGIIGGILANPGILADSAGRELFSYTPSGFLGALVAGFLAGGIVKLLKLIFSFLPKSLDGLKPIFIFPIFGTIIISVLMIFVINAPMATVMTSFENFINSLSGSSKLIVGFVVASMMAIDMGGPINKASYVTGTALLTAAGNTGSDVMAAVMIGGMVPPLAIAISATFNKNIWPKNQRNSAFINYIMSLAFITEGAIPFAASNPIRVIPPLFIASGISGSLSMLFGSFSKAPHGGIFAIIAGGVSNPIMYIISLFIGGIIGALLLILSLKTIKNK